MNVQRPTLNVQRSTNGQEYDLEDWLLEYAAQVIRLVERIPRTQAGTHVAGQVFSRRIGVAALLRSAESLQKANGPRFVEAWLQRRLPFEQHAFECRALNVKS